MGLRNTILQYDTLSMMCILVTGLKWRPQGGTLNKQRGSVRPYWLSSPLTAFRPPKYPVSASVQSTNSTKVFDALRFISIIYSNTSNIDMTIFIDNRYRFFSINISGFQPGMGDNKLSSFSSGQIAVSTARRMKGLLVKNTSHLNGLANVGTPSPVTCPTCCACTNDLIDIKNCCCLNLSINISRCVSHPGNHDISAKKKLCFHYD